MQEEYECGSRNDYSNGDLTKNIQSTRVFFALGIVFENSREHSNTCTADNGERGIQITATVEERNVEQCRSRNATQFTAEIHEQYLFLIQKGSAFFHTAEHNSRRQEA